MENTKHDLSYNEVKLDYQALIATAKIAVGGCMEEVGTQLADMRDLEPRFQISLSAEWLVRAANQLSIAAETLHALEEGLNRSKVTIVNKETPQEG